MKTPEEMAEEFSNWFVGERRKTIAKKSWYTGFEEGLKAAKDSASIDTNSIDTGTRMQWISIKDRLPEINKGFIGFVESNEVCNCYRYSDHSSDNSHVFYAQTKTGLLICGLESVTHWMPLPKPPENK